MIVCIVSPGVSQKVNTIGTYSYSTLNATEILWHVPCHKPVDYWPSQTLYPNDVHRAQIPQPTQFENTAAANIASAEWCRWGFRFDEFELLLLAVNMSCNIWWAGLAKIFKCTNRIRVQYIIRWSRLITANLTPRGDAIDGSEPKYTKICQRRTKDGRQIRTRKETRDFLFYTGGGLAAPS